MYLTNHNHYFSDVCVFSDIIHYVHFYLFSSSSFFLGLSRGKTSGFSSLRLILQSLEFFCRLYVVNANRDRGFYF